MYVSLILTPKIMADKYDEMGYSRRVLSRNAEFGGTLTAGMVPWSDNGIYMSTILGVATIEYLPWSCLGINSIFKSVPILLIVLSPYCSLVVLNILSSSVLF